MTSEVTSWPRTLSLYTTRVLSRRATRSFFREALTQSGARLHGGRTNPPVCRGRICNENARCNCTGSCTLQQKKKRKIDFYILDRIDDGEFNGAGLETLWLPVLQLFSIATSCNILQYLQHSWNFAFGGFSICWVDSRWEPRAISCSFRRNGIWQLCYWGSLPVSATCFTRPRAEQKFRWGWPLISQHIDFFTAGHWDEGLNKW